MSVGNQQKLWSAASGILDMTNKMSLLRAFDPEILLLGSFFAGFCWWSKATNTNGNNASIYGEVLLGGLVCS